MKVLKTIKSILGVTDTKAIPTDKNKAYSIYAYGRIEAPSIEELLDDEYKRILSDIETRASYGYTCLIYQYPAWMNKDNTMSFPSYFCRANYPYHDIGKMVNLGNCVKTIFLHCNHYAFTM